VSLTGQQVADTAGMRARADQINAAAREASRAAWEDSRRARQLAYEADLIDTADDAQAVYEGSAAALSRLEAEVAPLVAAEREAEDQLRGDTKRLARRTAELQKAQADDAPGERQEDLAARVLQLGRKAAVSQAKRDDAVSKRAAAEARVTAWAAQVASDYAEHVQASRAAENPGIAPGMPGIAPGVGRISDLDGETRQLMAAVAIMASAALTTSPTPASPDPAEAMKDKSKFRLLSLPGGRGVIVPPAMS
jgi:hypothetical protein